MKQKDIALIVVIAIIAAIASLLISNMLFGSAGSRDTQIEIVQPITATFAEPDPRYFNKDAFDPTRLISIGSQDPATDPFKGTGTQQ